MRGEEQADWQLRSFVLQCVAYVVFLGLAIAILVLVMRPARPTWQVGHGCEDGKQCTRNLENIAYGYCEYPPLPNTAKCTSLCYADDATSLHCDGVNGDCVGDDYTECLAYCTSDRGYPDEYRDDGHWDTDACLALYPLNAFSLSDAVTENRIFFNPDPACIANECRVFNIFLEFVGEMISTPELGWGQEAWLNDCNQHLNYSVPHVQAGCVKSFAHTLDPNVTYGMINDWYANNARINLYGKASSWQMHGCMFYMSCGAFNLTQWDDFGDFYSAPSQVLPGSVGKRMIEASAQRALRAAEPAKLAADMKRVIAKKRAV
jgi:hypothetical protein